MKLLRSLVFGVLIAVAFCSVASAQVKVTLVAADTAIQPGKPFTVALRLTHEPHWHTYWINPGTGLATTIAWKLPAGFTAGEIRWPAPRVLRDDTGAISGNGYEGELLLPIEITPPATLPAGAPVTLAATVDWLMCKDICKPGNAEVQLALPVATTPPAPDPLWHDKIARTLAELPRALPEWSVRASRDEKNVTLTLQPNGSATVRPAPASLRFFSLDSFVAHDAAQEAKTDSAGNLVLTFPVSPDGPKNPAQLLGVLTAETGWRAGGAQRGLLIAQNWTAADAASAPPPRATAAVTANASRGLLGTVLLAFIGGLILNLMPCVFPVLGIKILGFVNQAGHDRRRVTIHGIVFALGVLLSFWSLAAVLAILRAGGDQLGWGFQLQSPVFVFLLAVVMLVFALSMSGVFEFGLRATGIGANLQMKDGYSGSFFTGVLATVVATPCSAPFLAPALGAALALPTGESFVVFTAIALGLSVPYLLLSIFPGAVRKLPRPGAWMETFKQFMAFPLYATVGYLLWVLAGQTNDSNLLNVFFGLTLIAMATWLYGRTHAPGAQPAPARRGTLAGLALLALGVWLGWPLAAQPTDIVWDPWSAERVAQLRAEGRPIYVDFTARWCATCQANKRVVFHSDEVLRTFAAQKVATLRGDWTNRDPKITAELAKWGRSAVPFNLVYRPDRPEPIALPELLSPTAVLDALKR
ncbi:MAG: thioredoxin family protein [Opitutae bacterium]|nr:thioredoxin family protein [Opitutae bacterium]